MGVLSPPFLAVLPLDSNEFESHGSRKKLSKREFGLVAKWFGNSGGETGEGLGLGLGFYLSYFFYTFCIRQSLFFFKGIKKQMTLATRMGKSAGRLESTEYFINIK